MAVLFFVRLYVGLWSSGFAYQGHGASFSGKIWKKAHFLFCEKARAFVSLANEISPPSGSGKLEVAATRFSSNKHVAKAQVHFLLCKKA